MNGSGYGNAGIKKGVAVEAHDDILSYGQDPLDIAHIYNEAGLIQHAVDFTMEGEPEEAARQKALVNVRQAEIEASVVAAREALEAALTQRLNDSTASLDATVARLAAELYARENAAMAVVDSDRQAWTEAVAELKRQMLWAIKEQVWRLGYTSGYKFGAHDGVDHVILADIAARKDEFAAEVQATRDRMAARVVSETDIADAAYDAARAELQGEMDRLTAEMEEALAAAVASFEVKLADAKADMEAETQRAKDAHYAFIEARLAIWQTKYDAEKKNALW